MRIAKLYQVSLDWKKLSMGASRILASPNNSISVTVLRLSSILEIEPRQIYGISTNAMGKLEVNLMTTSLKTLINIANVLDLDMNYLLCGDEEKALDPL